MQSSPDFTPERIDTEFSPTPKGSFRGGLSNLYFPAYRAPAQMHDSFACSVIIGSRAGHLSQEEEESSEEEVLEELYNLQEVSRSPIRMVEELMESGDDKENLGESWKSCHRRQPSVIINTAVDQSYSHILSGLPSVPSSVNSSPSKTFYPVDKPRKSLYPQSRKVVPGLGTDQQHRQGSSDEISDCSSILESAGQKTVLDTEMNQPLQTLDQMLQDEHISTIYTNLSSDSSRLAAINQTDLFSTPAVKDKNRTSGTSPYGRTTNHTDSNHFEIDLFDTPATLKDQRESGDMSEHQLGALPTRAYCPSCQEEVSTRVSFELPRLPM